ncbi:hypothetical protein PCL_07883 [Purpureocillium lilacinum]|uniref:eRF1/Pelota-like N-terminal domain-containing protein n=3 Tax=Purpureocillium lilacinum TaxID=33203 RepID=A0A2U3EJ89_PURLI|nr:hypothetical protein Purlil1_4257 [Purpureocillium lilacinum]PWI74569.1 hypothetical protein PCL_07883 [Purpureocillium lilacinum]
MGACRGLRRRDVAVVLPGGEIHWQRGVVGCSWRWRGPMLSRLDDTRSSGGSRRAVGPPEDAWGVDLGGGTWCPAPPIVCHHAAFSLPSSQSLLHTTHTLVQRQISFYTASSSTPEDAAARFARNDPPPRTAVKMSDAQANEAERNIEIWKVKKLIKRLEAARGNGTSMISLIIPPKDQVSRAAKMLAEEYGTASNIKSRVNRQSVLSAITSTQQRLKLYNKVPPNGLVIYCGEILTQEGKERKVNIDFEPFKPINTSLYLCDNKFHTEALAELLESDQKFGFIIMDGNGALFGTLSGNTRDIVHKFSVDLPKKHGRGGQSALRFARLREEKRHNYVRKVAELAVQNFITNDKVNVAGLILAGSADFKNDLNASDMFDNRLATKVIKVVDVSYGGENGFNQAIELSSETLGNVKFIQEKKLIGKYFEEISQDTGKVCYGIEDTLKALELGAVETLIVFENLEITRWTLKDSEGREIILHTTKQQEQNRDQFLDKQTGQEMDIVAQESFLEWIAEHYKDFGTALEFVSDRSTEGNQFVKGFGGIGGILRYKVNFEQLNDLEDDDDDYYDADSLVNSEGPAQVQPSVLDEEDERRGSSRATEAAPMSFAEKRLKRRAEAESRTKGHEASRPSPLRSMMTAT